MSERRDVSCLGDVEMHHLFYLWMSLALLHTDTWALFCRAVHPLMLK